ncbi:MAG: hypothetical protein E7458_10425 [Ruminococcaceae bacterium]|nr:hypothetical protein [Oscillospiraceae bacterium]
MKTLHKIIIACLIAALLITPFSAAAEERVSISLDGSEVTLERPAYFDSETGILMAPASLFPAALGTELSVDAESGSVTLTRGNTVIGMTLGGTDAKINSRSVTLDVPPVMQEDEVLLPLRFCAENLGFELNWHADEHRVELLTIYEYELKITEEKMREIYGQPRETLISEKGYTWQVYHEDYREYQLIGVDHGRVVAYYLGSENWRLPFGIQYGTKLATCHTLMNGLGYQSATGTGYTTFYSDEAVLTVYYSAEAENPVYAALYEAAEYTDAEAVTPAALQSMERLLMDLTNVARVRQGLLPLAASQSLSAVAKLHAGDMAAGDFFSHQGTDLQNKTGRMSAAGFGDCYVSEVISKAYPDSFTTFASFLVNPSYQEILNANFTDVGAGFAYNPDSEGVLYCTQLFYAEKY